MTTRERLEALRDRILLPGDRLDGVALLDFAVTTNEILDGLVTSMLEQEDRLDRLDREHS